ncbi:MAG: hypothetical protein ACOYEV_13280 [Candidatus Nanopelagicales bacterium]
MPQVVDGSGKAVGIRQEIGDQLRDGDRVWVLVEGGILVQVKRAVIWRSPGLFALSERIRDFGPCTDPTNLCPSCAAFGVANEAGKQEGPARQDSYAGHVRFGWGAISGEPDEPVWVRPMGQPRPGAGQFYLDNRKLEGQSASRGTDDRKFRPLREWGSEGDTDFGEKAAAAARPATLREIRGRKRFWATSDQGNRHIGDAPNATAKMGATSRRLVPAGAPVTATIVFDALTEAQVGALLVAVAPQLLAARVWPEQGPELVHHLGGGKGLGLGVVTSEIVSWEAAGPERYAAAPSSAPPDDRQHRCVSAFLDSVSDGVMATWPALLALLSLDHVPAALVEYPPDKKGMVAGRSGTFAAHHR